MIAFITIVYTALVVLLFKFRLLKPRPIPIASIVLVGVLLIGGIFVVWMQCAPISPRVVTTQYVIQLVPYVKGQILKIHARANQPVKQGDLLLEINPAPFHYSVRQAEAQLLAATETVNQARAALGAAKANIDKAKADVNQARAAREQAEAAVNETKAALVKTKADDELAKTEEQIALNVQKADAGAISTLRVTQAVQKRQAADAAVKQASAAVDQSQAGVRQAEATVAAALSAEQQSLAAERQSMFTLKVAQSNVPAVQAQLDDAKFNLDQCRMTAPADGYVVDWQVQEGTMLVPTPLAAAGTFVNTAETTIIASFPQNYLTNVQPNDDVEFILDPYPGRLFKGKVDFVIPATGEGQFAPTGQLPSASKVGSMGLLAVKVRLTGEADPPSLPLGAGGIVAIYTTSGKPVHIISKVTIRMEKWLLYFFPSSHGG